MMPPPASSNSGGQPTPSPQQQQQQQPQQQPAPPQPSQPPTAAATTAPDVTAAAVPTAAPVPASRKPSKTKKPKRAKDPQKEEAAAARKKARKQAKKNQAPVSTLPDALSPEQQAVQAQMRRALEEDQYSAVGSIIHNNDESDEEADLAYNYRGVAIRLDKAALQQAIRKHNLLERGGSSEWQVDAAQHQNSHHQRNNKNNNNNDTLMMNDDDETEPERRGGKPKKSKKKRKDEVSNLQADLKRGATGVSPTPGALLANPLDPLDHLTGTSAGTNNTNSSSSNNNNNSSHHLLLHSSSLTDPTIADLDRDGGSIFGATTGSNSNSTWVECDKCKKWRRLRGVVDEKKLPSKWYCTMNKNDPDRSRCAAPEEEYEAPHTPESAADARTRKHLRVWVRRLQCNQAYEGRQPTLTRGKKRAAASSSKDPYEWVRCCNPSCGKWRSLLKMMEGKAIVERSYHGEWFCVMNNWDEKAASCAAPQENLPAVGCPAWIMQDGTAGSSS